MSFPEKRRHSLRARRNTDRGAGILPFDRRSDCGCDDGAIDENGACLYLDLDPCLDGEISLWTQENVNVSGCLSREPVSTPLHHRDGTSSDGAHADALDPHRWHICFQIGDDDDDPATVGAMGTWTLI